MWHNKYHDGERTEIKSEEEPLALVVEVENYTGKIRVSFFQ
jgi:hypothetical protein